MTKTPSLGVIIHIVTPIAVGKNFVEITCWYFCRISWRNVLQKSFADFFPTKRLGYSRLCLDDHLQLQFIPWFAQKRSIVDNLFNSFHILVMTLLKIYYIVSRLREIR